MVLLEKCLHVDEMHAPKTLKPLEAGVPTALLLSSGGLAQSKSIKPGAGDNLKEVSLTSSRGTVKAFLRLEDPNNYRIRKLLITSDYFCDATLKYSRYENVFAQHSDRKLEKFRMQFF